MVPVLSAQSPSSCLQPGEAGRGNPESRSKEERRRRGRSGRHRRRGEKMAGSSVPSVAWESHFEALPILGTYIGYLFLNKQK